MKKVYAVYNESDLTEGRGPYKLIAIFENYHDAEKCKNKQPTVMGVKPLGLHAKIEELQLFLNYPDWENDTIEKIKFNALNKLTNEERRVLGY